VVPHSGRTGRDPKVGRRAPWKRGLKLTKRKRKKRKRRRKRRKEGRSRRD
jgi:hypothetical protein